MGFCDFFLCHTNSDNMNIRFLSSSPLTAVMIELKKGRRWFARVRFPSEKCLCDKLCPLVGAEKSQAGGLLRETISGKPSEFCLGIQVVN